ncbi:MAG: thioredoxin [Bacteroidales bacterium]|nr:thioredoxin [Bacteroidales bacterium]
MMVEINDSNFATLVGESKIPVVIDFWAPWCGPCRMVSPIVDQLAEEYAGKVLIAKCNVDESSEVPSQFAVRNIPTIVFLKNGELVDKNVGATTKAVLAEKVNKLL